MSKTRSGDDMPTNGNLARRHFLKKLGGVAAAAGTATTVHAAWGGNTLGDTFADFFQQQYREMSREEVRETLERIERKAKKRYGVDIHCKDTPAQPGVLFGYALNISKCRGYRDCVHACVRENNLSRDTFEYDNEFGGASKVFSLCPAVCCCDFQCDGRSRPIRTTGPACGARGFIAGECW